MNLPVQGEGYRQKKKKKQTTRLARRIEQRKSKLSTRGFQKTKSFTSCGQES